MQPAGALSGFRLMLCRAASGFPRRLGDQNRLKAGVAASALLCASPYAFRYIRASHIR